MCDLMVVKRRIDRKRGGVLLCLSFVMGNDLGRTGPDQRHINYSFHPREINEALLCDKGVNARAFKGHCKVSVIDYWRLLDPTTNK